MLKCPRGLIDRPTRFPRRSLLLCAAAAISVSLSGCVQNPTPFDPLLAQRWERAKDNQVKSRPMLPLPTTVQSRYMPGATVANPEPIEPGMNSPEGPSVVMSLQEIIHRTILNSLAIRVSSFDTAVDETRVMEAEAKFDPSLFTNFNFERVDKESPGTFSNFDPVFNSTTPPHLAHFSQSDTSSFQWGFQQDLPAGGQAKLQYQVQNTWTNPQQTPLTTFYENELSLQITQPLLQNFGLEVNQARITIARNTQRISLLDFRKTVQDTVFNLEKTYWQLVEAERDVKTIEQLVAESQGTAKLLFQRQGQDVTAVQIQQANSATETRRGDLIDARTKVADLSDQIKELMNDPRYPVSGNIIIMPANDEIDVPLNFDVDELIETALDNRLELGQQQVRINSAAVAMKVAKNNLLPSLNFQGSVTSDGVGHNLGAAFGNQGDFNHIGYSAGLQLLVPLGNRAARAIWQRALLQRRQAIDSYSQIVEQVTQEVKTAARDLHSAYETIGRRRSARLLAAQTLNSLQKQFEAGDTPLTPEFVQLRLQYQEILASAEEAESLALFNYNVDIATLEKAKGTLLRYNNIIMEQKQLPFDMAVDRPQFPHEERLTDKSVH